MSYRHYGEIGDVWKHLPLCEIIKEIRPKLYIESNSAYPFYHLDQTSERGYGIEYFLAHAPRSPLLAQSLYYQITATEHPKKIYLGSPGLAFTLLGGNANYLFCDLEGEALQEIEAYGTSLGLGKRVTLHNGDAVEYCFANIAEWPAETLVFLDPCSILEKTVAGRSFFDLFLETMQRKVPAVLWYGFDTRRQQQALHEVFVKTLKSGSGVALAEINLANIGLDQPTINPGVAGCGLLMANLDSAIVAKVNQLCIHTKNIYMSSVYRDQPGKLQITMDYF